MKFKKLITTVPLITLLALNSPADNKNLANLGKICGYNNKCATSLKEDLDDDGEKEYLKLERTTEATAISEFCGYTLTIKDINYKKDIKITWEIYNIAKVKLEGIGRAYGLETYICSTESEEGETGKGKIEISEIKHYVWNGERLIE